MRKGSSFRRERRKPPKSPARGGVRLDQDRRRTGQDEVPGCRSRRMGLHLGGCGLQSGPLAEIAGGGRLMAKFGPFKGRHSRPPIVHTSASTPKTTLVTKLHRII